MKKANTVQAVLNNVNDALEFLEDSEYSGLDIRSTYEQLSIFDWWKDSLSRQNLRDMKSFLELALELGLTGYCCFKVGMKGYTNGMWACEYERTDDCTLTAFKGRDAGKEIYRTFLGVQYPKKYSFSLGGNAGFCDETYQSKIDLKRAFLAATQPK